MEVTSDGKYPVIGTSKIEIVLFMVGVQIRAEAKIQFKTISTRQIVLVGKFGPKSCSTAKAAADVLCVGSKGQA